MRIETYGSNSTAIPNFNEDSVNRARKFFPINFSQQRTSTENLLSCFKCDWITEVKATE